MEKRTIVIGISMLVVIAACFSRVEGTLWRAMILEHLTKEATHIVIGTVIRQEGREDPLGNPKRSLPMLP